MADRALAAVGDDQLVRRHVVGGEDVADRLLDALAGQRLAVELEHVARGVRAAQKIPCHIHRRLGRALSAADPLQLGRVLHPPAPRELLAVDGQLETCRAQVVGELDGKARRDDRGLDADRAAGAFGHVEVELVARHALVEQLLPAQLVPRQHVHADPAHARHLERVDGDDPPAVPLRVEKRVGDGHGHLVPQLRRAQRVSVDEDVGHEAQC